LPLIPLLPQIRRRRRRGRRKEEEVEDEAEKRRENCMHDANPQEEDLHGHTKR